MTRLIDKAMERWPKVITSSPVPNSAKIMSAFKLTRAEMAIALHISRGHTCREISLSTGRTIETVRDQLKRIMAKTDTHVQNELAYLVMRVH